MSAHGDHWLKNYAGSWKIVRRRHARPVGETRKIPDCCTHGEATAMNKTQPPPSHPPTADPSFLLKRLREGKCFLYPSSHRSEIPGTAEYTFFSQVRCRQPASRCLVSNYARAERVEITPRGALKSVVCLLVVFTHTHGYCERRPPPGQASFR